MRDWEELSPGLVDFIGSITTTEEAKIFLQSYGLMQTDQHCHICDKPMEIYPKSSCLDGYMYRCTICGVKVSIRRGSPFYNAKLKLPTICMLLYLFAQDIKVNQVERLMPKVSRHTICKWFAKFRKICVRYLADNPVMMEGMVFANQVVEIDESIFGKRRKYNKGRKHRQEWVFGLIQKETRKIVLRIVHNRTKATLIPIINEFVQSGATIYHDDWASYRKLDMYGYKHGIVNHSKEFKSKDGVCTNTIEGVWGDVKTRIRGMHGVRMKLLPNYLEEYSYRYMMKDQHGSIYNSFLEHFAWYW